MRSLITVGGKTIYSIDSYRSEKNQNDFTRQIEWFLLYKIHTSGMILIFIFTSKSISNTIKLYKIINTFLYTITSLGGHCSYIFLNIWFYFFSDSCTIVTILIKHLLNRKVNAKNKTVKIMRFNSNQMDCLLSTNKDVQSKLGIKFGIIVQIKLFLLDSLVDAILM